MAEQRIIVGDCRTALATLPDGSVHVAVTSPPYWNLRSYLPDAVRLRADISDEEAAYVMAELERLNIRPTSNEV